MRETLHIGLMSFSDHKEILTARDIPFMNYGIINQFNFSPDKVQQVPIKRWDPLGFNFGLNEKYAQYSYMYGHYSYISPIRSARPVERKKDIENDSEIKTEPSEDPNWDAHPVDVIEPMMRGLAYKGKSEFMPAHAIIIADGDKPLDDPFTDQAQCYHYLTGNAMTMINRYPAMVRLIDRAILPQITDVIGKTDPNAKIAYGVCLLTFPRHYFTRIQDIGNKNLQEMFLSMLEGIRMVINAAKRQFQTVAVPISTFFNVGKMVGGSLKRIHSQVYLDLSQDGHGAHMENLLNAFEKNHQQNTCPLCQSTHGRRNILENEDWVIFATGSPLRNYHLRFTPKKHIQEITALTPTQLLSFTKILRVIFQAMDDVGVNPNRNILFNTRPSGYETDFHIFGDILPFEFVGGAELLDDMRVIRLSPQTAAEQLRKVIKEKYQSVLEEK